MNHAAGIDSPGHAGSPAIALEVVRLLCAAGLELKRNASFDGKRYPLVMPKKRVKGITYGPKGNKLVQDAAMEGKVTWHLHFILNLLGYINRFAANHERLSNVEIFMNHIFLSEHSC